MKISESLFAVRVTPGDPRRAKELSDWLIDPRQEALPDGDESSAVLASHFDSDSSSGSGKPS